MATSLGVDLQINKCRKRRVTAAPVPSRTVLQTIVAGDPYFISRRDATSWTTNFAQSSTTTFEDIPAEWINLNRPARIRRVTFGDVSFQPTRSFITLEFRNAIDIGSPNIHRFKTSILDDLKLTFTTNTGKSVEVYLSDRVPTNQLSGMHRFEMDDVLLDEFIDSLVENEDTTMVVEVSLLAPEA